MKLLALKLRLDAVGNVGRQGETAAAALAAVSREHSALRKILGTVEQVGGVYLVLLAPPRCRECGRVRRYKPVPECLGIHFIGDMLLSCFCEIVCLLSTLPLCPEFKDISTHHWDIGEIREGIRQYEPRDRLVLCRALLVKG